MDDMKVKRSQRNPLGTDQFFSPWQRSQGIRVGELVWVSGQFGIGRDGKPGTTIEEQTHLAFQNLAGVLVDIGATLADVVELTSYHIAMDDLAKVAAIKAEYFLQDYPAWSAVGVARLVLPELLLEIKAMAVIGSNCAGGQERLI